MYYLDIFNYFQSHIPLISRLIASLNTLWNSTKVLEEWTPEYQSHFESLKSLLPLVPPLVYLNFEKEFYIAIDTSDVGISIILYQVVNRQLITTTNTKHH